MAGTSEAAPARRIIGQDCELDLIGERLVRGGQEIPLRPKSWLVLRHLSERQGVLVSIDDLLDVAWPGAAVTPNTLSNVILELRRALGDNASDPRFIQTVHRRGFRWLGGVSGTQGQLSTSDPPGSGPRAEVFVGRRVELERLGRCWSDAKSSRRQLAFVGGDAGIGKSTIVAEFVRSLEDGEGLVARGSAVELTGALEPYVPFLAAIDDLLSRERELLLPLLRSCAPGWLAMLPWRSELEASPSSPVAQPDPAPSLLFQGVAVWEAVAATRPTLLVIEDLHMADAATMGLVALLAERAPEAKLMLLATWRSAQAIATEHPSAALVRRLQASARATVISLSSLPLVEIERWLSHRFASDSVAAALAPEMERMSEGNPLFLRALCQQAIELGIIANDGGTWQLSADPAAALHELPDDLRAIVEAQLDLLGPDESEVLEVAAAVGPHFFAQDVASGCERPVAAVDSLCHRLAHSRQFIRPLGGITRPDGTRGGDYEFVHSLFRRACYARMSWVRRQLVHQRIALGMEKSCGERTTEVAYQLAAHFEAADDLEKAVHYLAKAAASAVEPETQAQARERLEHLLQRLADQPRSGARDSADAQFQLTGFDFQRTGGDYFQHYQTAERLALRAGDSRLVFSARYGLAVGQLALGETEQAELTAGKLLVMADRELPALRAQALTVVSFATTVKGEFAKAAASLAEAVTLEPEPGIPAAVDQRAWQEINYAYVLAMLGKRREAEGWLARALARCAESDHLVSHAMVATHAAETCIVLRDPDRAAQFNERSTEISQQLIGKTTARNRAIANWAAFENAPSNELCGAMENVRQRRWLSWPTLLASAQRRVGRFDEALETINAGFQYAIDTNSGIYLAELHRERGELAISQSSSKGFPEAAASAESQFREALRIARHQSARLFELRATTSLARLLQGLGRTAEAVRDLQRIVSTFDGEVGGDVAEAQSLLATF
jgi:DNA-binding winged helix-turn-helix (wHTH) protein/tetratricopeptide (TPR) repeat protein